VSTFRGAILTIFYKDALTEALALEAAILRLRMLTTDEDLIRRVIDDAAMYVYGSATREKLSDVSENAARKIACGAASLPPKRERS